jgi:hypothetical protein
MVVSSDSGNAAQHESHGPAILLPPSTTVSPASSSNDDSLYPSVKDMECGDQADAKDHLAGDGVTTATVVPVVIASTHRIHGSGLGNLGKCCSTGVVSLVLPWSVCSPVILSKATLVS